MFYLLKHTLPQVLTKLQRQNLDQTSPSTSWPHLKLKVLTKSYFKSPSKSWPDFYVLWYLDQNLDQVSASKSLPKCCPTRSSASTLAKLTTSRNFELASSEARVTSVKSAKQEWVSESLTRVANALQWSDLGPIKTLCMYVQISESEPLLHGQKWPFLCQLLPSHIANQPSIGLLCDIKRLCYVLESYLRIKKGRPRIDVLIVYIFLFLISLYIFKYFKYSLLFADALSQNGRIAV